MAAAQKEAGGGGSEDSERKNRAEVPKEQEKEGVDEREGEERKKEFHRFTMGQNRENHR